MNNSTNRRRLPLLFLAGVAALTFTTLSMQTQPRVAMDNCFAGRDLDTLSYIGHSLHEKILAGEEVSERTIFYWMSAVQAYCSSHSTKSEAPCETRRNLEFQYDLMLNALLRGIESPSAGRNAGLLLPTL